MKKSAYILSGILITSLFSPVTAIAENTDSQPIRTFSKLSTEEKSLIESYKLQAKSFTNSEGVYISEKEYKRLVSIGFNPEDIENMDSEEYNMNENLNGEVIGSEVKYLKKTSFEDNNSQNIQALFNLDTGKASSPSMLDNSTVINEYLTKEDFEDELKNDEAVKAVTVSTSIKNLATRDTMKKHTEYKLLKLYLVKFGKGKYRATSIMSWKKMPKNRGVDVLAMVPGYEDVFSISRTNRSAKQYYTFKRPGYKTGHATIRYNKSSGVWDDTYGGAAIKPNLKNDWYVKNKQGIFDEVKVTKIKFKMYYDFNLNIPSNKYTHDRISVSSAYSHRKTESSFPTSLTLSPGSPTITFENPSQRNSFDGEIRVTGTVKK